jgi:hypothetical protein
MDYLPILAGLAAALSTVAVLRKAARRATWCPP